MLRLHLLGLLSAVALLGCDASAPTGEKPAEETEVEAVDIVLPEAETAPAENPAEAKTEMPTETPESSDADSGTTSLDGEVKLDGENTLIQFVGAHSGDKPDPRTGNFSKLAGVAKFTKGLLSAIDVEIETGSLTTEIDKLTDHLKSPDFFNVREFPKATFKMTAVESTETNKLVVTGDLTLLGETKSITFPATIEDGKLKAEFVIDRTIFGMNYGEGKVEKDVSMTIEVTTK
ncbi:MAG: YceI family protein [Blastopirellula sp. JB062]